MVNLQAQLANIKEQAAQSNILKASAVIENPNEKYSGKPNNAFCDNDLQRWFQPENPNMGTQLHPNLSNINSFATQNYGDSSTSTAFMHLNPIGNYENSGTMEESVSFSSFHEDACNSMSCDMHTSRWQWGFHEVDDLQSVAFGYSGSSSAS